MGVILYYCVFEFIKDVCIMKVLLRMGWFKCIVLIFGRGNDLVWENKKENRMKVFLIYKVYCKLRGLDSCGYF